VIVWDCRVKELVNVVLLDERKQLCESRVDVERGRLMVSCVPFTARREISVGARVVVKSESDLLEVVAARHPSRGLADLLDGRQEQSMRIAMMAITTSNSISVKADLRPRRLVMRTSRKQSNKVGRSDLVR